jgi:putative SOS response-associated peptidase YedK
MLEEIESRFHAKFAEPAEYKPIYHASAFKTPLVPVITDDMPDQIQLVRWGLVPFWVKNRKGADEIRFKTLNAKSETIFDKPSFRTSIQTKRCLVIVDGFFEWHHEGSNKYPFYIHKLNRRLFALAGIWDMWEDKKTGEALRTFSIITTEANPLLSEIHNTKKRMPVILSESSEQRWLEVDLSREDIEAILKPYDKSDLEAHTVSKLISARGKNSNVEEVQKKFDHDELKTKQKNLF